MSINLNDIITYGNAQFKVVKVATSNDVDDKFDLNNDWCYIYPNNGTEANPANVSNNSSYIMDNPFPNYIVSCIPEILYNNEWGTTEFTQQGFGFAAHQHNNNKIVLVTGYYYLINVTSTRNQYYLYTWNAVGETITTAPCRIKVYKVGKMGS